MATEISKSQIDKLGERLKKGSITDKDMEILESFRRSFTSPYNFVAERLGEVLGFEPTARPLKSTTSIVDKLRREGTRLSTMQDIAGCRITVADIRGQNSTVRSIETLLEQDSIEYRSIDRRAKMRHGYRAVHIIAQSSNRNIEIQIRTALQHTWAELCEGLADSFGHDLKYGGGDTDLRDILLKVSTEVSDIEGLEAMIARNSVHPSSSILQQEIESAQLSRLETLQNLLRELNELKEKR